MTAPLTDMHEARLERVVAFIKATGARRVLDLGCGSGLLLHRLLLDPQFETVVGLEESGGSLMQARTMLGDFLQGNPPRLTLLRGSYADHSLADKHALTGFDAAAMVETIEHVPARSLSKVELAVFARLRPRIVFMTTPNQEYNPLYGLRDGEFRDSDHRFEWNRAKFQQWCRGVAERNHYRVAFGGLGDYHADAGHSTQTALFTFADESRR